MPSVPLTPADVDTLGAYFAVTPAPGLDPGSLALTPEETLVLPRVASTPELHTTLGRLGYVYTDTEQGLVITGANPQSAGGSTSRVRAERARLSELAELAELEGRPLLQDPDRTDDPRVVRKRVKLLRRRLMIELKLRSEKREAEVRKAVRERRADERTHRITERAQAQRARRAERQAVWEQNTEMLGRRAILRRRNAIRPEQRAATIKRTQIGVLVVGAGAIISLGTSSTASVAKFMTKYASATPATAWGMEPAIIATVVGINIIRYVMTQNHATLPWGVRLVEYGALVGSVAMAGLGAGAGAIVAPIGVAVVTFTAGSLIEALGRIDPEGVADTGKATRPKRQRQERRSRVAVSPKPRQHFAPVGDIAAPTVARVASPSDIVASEATQDVAHVADNVAPDMSHVGGDTSDMSLRHDTGDSDKMQVTAHVAPVVSLSKTAQRRRQVLEILVAEPDIKGAEVGDKIGATSRTGQRLVKELSPLAAQVRQRQMSLDEAVALA